MAQKRGSDTIKPARPIESIRMSANELSVVVVAFGPNNTSEESNRSTNVAAMSRVALGTAAFLCRIVRNIRAIHPKFRTPLAFQINSR